MTDTTTTRLSNTVSYFVTKDIDYPYLPSEACAAARSQLKSILGLTAVGHDILFDMMLEIEGMVKTSEDRWLGFGAALFSKDRLPHVRQLVETGLLVRQILLDNNGHDRMVVYFLSPGVVA